MSYKNLLQEYCQKNKLSMPKYECKSIGMPHELSWYCKITIFDREFYSTNSSKTKIESEQCVAKIVLEHINNTKILIPTITSPSPSIITSPSPSIITSPSSSIITSLSSPTIISTSSLTITSPSSPTITLPSSPNTIYIIDLENRPMFNQTLDDQCIYIGFHNSMHHSMPKYVDWHICDSSDIGAELSASKSNKFIYTIEGGVSDLVDHLMTMFMYPLAIYLKSNNLIENIYIVSGDKAGFCTKLCLEQALKWNNVKNVIIKNTISI